MAISDINENYPEEGVDQPSQGFRDNFGHIKTELTNLLNTKQGTLVSGTNIKTINGASVLGSGDLVVGGGASIGSLSTPSANEALSTQEASLNFGHIDKPVGFTLPSYISAFTAKYLNNKATTNITPYLVDTTTYTQTMYVDNINGNDANDGLSWATRKKSIGNAYRAAQTSGIATRILVYKTTKPYYRQVGITDNSADLTGTTPILLEAVNGRVTHGCYDDLVWTKTGGLTYTYQATRSNAVNCLNASIKGDDGHYKEYKWVTSSSLVDAEEGTWYTDGTTVYVRPHNDKIPSLENVRVPLVGAKAFRLNANANMVVRGFDFEGGAEGAIKIGGGSTNIVVFDDCTMKYATSSNINTGGTTEIDGAVILGCGLFAAFNCEASKNTKDGFNLHQEGAVKPNALLVDCKGQYNGASSSVSNNGFSAHDGCKAISVNGDWRYNYGPGSAHINDGTEVWEIGDVSGASVGDVIFGGTATFSAFAAYTGAPKLFLDNCKDVGSPFGIYRADSAEITTRNHNGSGQVSAGVLQS